MYVINSEHTPTSPITRGWGTHCINATTGEKIWSISGIWSWSAMGFPGAIADGYLIVSSSDGYMYVFGKGPTQLTVEAPNNGVQAGSTIVIRGTVVDVSPGTKDPNIQARFPNGVPAVSDGNMSEWVEYVYLQQPRPTNIKGVWVKLDAVNVYTGEYIDIGGAFTDPYSGVFAVSWQPPKEGLWWIIASFPGSKGYWPSFAQTSIAVTAALPAPAVGIAPESMPYIVALIITIIIIVLLAVYTVSLRRKVQK
jgi:hypothetical protein